MFISTLNQTQMPAAGEAAADGGAAVRKAPRASNDAPLSFSTRKDAADAKLEMHRFESSRQLQQTTDQGATRVNEAETEHDRDAR